MYSAFWGFREEPFSFGPGPALLCQSRQHDEMLARLIYGVQFRKGLIALTGEPGTGKTTLLNCLRDFLQTQRTDCLFFSNSRIDAGQLWELICSSLYLRSNPKSKMEVFHEFRELLLDTARYGGTTVLIVDEAQNLGPDVFEEIRLLGNLEDRCGRLLQIVLAGQPEFESKLDTPELRPLKQRIAYRCSLHPFTEAQTYSYIATRLKWAGMPEQTAFPPDVLAEIHVRSQGITRVINTICDNLLLAAFARASKLITLDMLDTVTRDLRLEWDMCDRRQQTSEAQVEQKTPLRLDTALLMRLGLLPAGFNQADGPAPAEISGNPGPSISPLPVDTATSRPSQFENISNRVRTTIGSAAQIAKKTIHEIRSRLPEPSVELRRGALAFLSVLLFIWGSVLLWKPGVQWIGTLRAAASVTVPLQPGEIARPETGPLTTARKPIEETGPRAVRMEPAEYTPAARYAGFRGKVFVVVTVDPQGKAKNIQFTAPTAFDLDIAVRKVAPAWRFKPAMRDGKSVEGQTLVQVQFR